MLEVTSGLAPTILLFSKPKLGKLLEQKGLG
jgi:hypothetical protein